MSKFLYSSPSLESVQDGSLPLYGVTIGAANLTPNFPVKVDASRRLYSTALAINDITGLQSDLTALQNVTQNIDPVLTVPGNTQLVGALTSSSKVEALGLSMVQLGIAPPAQASKGILYSDTSNQLHYTTTGGGDVILASSGVYLPLIGGTMSGAINMGAQNITNIATLSGATNSRTADNILSCSTAQTTGNLLSFTAATKVAADSGVIATNVVTNAGTGAAGSLASFSANKIIQDAGITASNVVTNAGASTSGNLPSFSSATGKVVADSAIASANVVQNTGGVVVSGDLASFSGTTGRLVVDSALVAANVVTNAGTGAAGSLASFSANKIIQDAGITASNVVTNAGTATSGRVATFSANKVIQDGGTLLSALATSAAVAATYLPLAGGTMTGALAMGVNGITGTGANSAGSYAASLTTASTTTGTGAITSAGGLGVAGAINAGGIIKTTDATSCISVGTGSLQCGGGASVAENLILGGSIGAGGAIGASGTIGTTSTAASTSTSTGALYAGSGGIGCGGRINAGGAIKTFDTTASTTTGTGSLICAGGLGVAGSIFSGAINASSITFSSTSGIIGTTTNNSAAAGSIGEYISATASPALSNGIIANATSISLTAGDWDVCGSIQVSCSGSMTVITGSISTTSVTHNSSSSAFTQLNLVNGFVSSGLNAIPVGTLRLSIAGTTTVYLTIQANFSSGTTGSNGFLNARRVR